MESLQSQSYVECTNSQDYLQPTAINCQSLQKFCSLNNEKAARF